MFDDIRPYRDEEIPDAMRRIVSDPAFPVICGFLFPEQSRQEVAARLESCRTVDDFQQNIMIGAFLRVMRHTIDEFSWEGLERLDRNTPYLFVSNHRDIVLDAALLEYVLFQGGFRTTEITFGANLMQGQLVIDVGKSNKMFRVERPETVTSVRDFFERTQYLSHYIRHTLLEKKESVWIAQRNGRTKDGLDATDQGIIKMFGMSGGEDPVEALDSLHICPVCISYEWEPCDVLKALELFARMSGPLYIKKPGEDMNSILTGIRQAKGRVHLAICNPLQREELEPLRDLPASAFNQEVAALIDRRICGAYRLYPNSFIADDWLKETHSARYTPEQEKAFRQHVETASKDYPIAFRDILLHIYANPVRRAL